MSTEDSGKSVPFCNKEVVSPMMYRSAKENSGAIYSIWCSDYSHINKGRLKTTEVQHQRNKTYYVDALYKTTFKNRMDTAKDNQSGERSVLITASHFTVIFFYHLLYSSCVVGYQEKYKIAITVQSTID